MNEETLQKVREAAIAYRKASDEDVMRAFEELVYQIARLVAEAQK